MTTLENEIAAYKSMLSVLEKEHFGKWVVFHDKELMGAYDTFEDAGRDATARFGRGPCLIRQVGAPKNPIMIPSVFQVWKA